MTIRLRSFLVILLVAIPSGCARQQLMVPNIVFCGDKAKFGATCVESLHPEKPGFRMAKSAWDIRRIGMVCTDAENITTLQNIIDKLCANNRTVCYYASEGVVEVQRALTAASKASGSTP